MISLLWLAVGSLAAADTTGLVATDRTVEAPIEAAVPVKLWINSSRQFREGERAKVQVETARDGYLLIFNYDTDGRLRVLFPLDPRDDNFVRAGRRYEVQGRGDRESFIVGRDGSGLVYAATSADPFRLDEIVAAGNWDYTRLSISEDSRDPEADITDLVQRMSTDRGFDYDLLDYRVYGYNTGYQTTSVGWYPRSYGYYDDYYCDPSYRPSLFGCRYNPSNGWYSGWGGYSRYGYGYGSGYGYYDGWYGGGYYGNYPRYSHNSRYPIVVGRPRGYTIVRHNPNGDVGRGRTGGTFGGGSLPRGLNNNGSDGIGYRPRGGNGRGDRPDGDRVNRPSGDAPRGITGESRPRGRRSPVGQSERPNIDRETRPNIDREIGGRGSVDVGNGGGRRAAGNDDDRRPAVQPEAPREERRARRSGGDDQPRAERPTPRGEDRPRVERPRDPPPPRAEPRQSPPPSPRPSNGGGGGGERRPRGRPPV